MKIPNISLMSVSRYMKPCLTLVAIFLLLEIVIFNITVVYMFWSFKDTVASVLNSPGRSWWDKLAANPTFEGLVEGGKDGGLVTALQETLDRLYIQSYQGERCGNSFGPLAANSQQGSKSLNGDPQLSFIGLDVSSAGESLYLYRRILQKAPGHWQKLVVDVGANDGFLSSNSYNFIQWGWSAVLVEPQSYQLLLAQRNLQRYIDPYGDGSQFVHFVKGVLGEKDGRVPLVLSKDSVQMESHVFNQFEDDISRVIEVKSYSVQTLATEHNIPKHFGILSIDAEGSSKTILRRWMELGFRPAYIICEELHEGEPAKVTRDFLEQHGYRFLTDRKWNTIFEYTEFDEPKPDGS